MMNPVIFTLVAGLGAFVTLLGTLLLVHAMSFKATREVIVPCFAYFGFGVGLIWLAFAYAPFSTPWGAA